MEMVKAVKVRCPHCKCQNVVAVNANGFTCDYCERRIKVRKTS